MHSTRDSIVAAFKNVAKPTSARALAPHACEECNDLAKALLPYSFDAVPHTVIQGNFDGLPLLSAAGFHYYLPAWLLDGLEVPGSSALAWAIVHLTPSAKDLEGTPGYFDQRFAQLDSSQRQALGLFFADVIAYQLFDGSAGELDRARQRWPTEA
jgi:hypothetical protein